MLYLEAWGKPVAFYNDKQGSPGSTTLRVNFSLGAGTIGAENFAWLAEQTTEAAAQRSKPQPAQTVPQPGSVEWFQAQKNKG